MSDITWGHSMMTSSHHSRCSCSPDIFTDTFHATILDSTRLMALDWPEKDISC